MEINNLNEIMLYNILIFNQRVKTNNFFQIN